MSSSCVGPCSTCTDPPVVLSPFSWFPLKILLQTWAFRSCERRVYSFPIGTVTNCHKLCSLQPHTFIILQFWKSEVCRDSLGQKSRYWQSCVPSGSSAVGIYFFASSSFSRLFTFLRCGLSPIFKDNSAASSNLSLTDSCDFAPFTFQDPCDYMWHTWKIQDDHPISRFLT